MKSINKAMKAISKYIFLFVLAFVFTNGYSQSKVALEQIQIYSSIHPTADYWHLSKDMSQVMNVLDTGIFSKLNLQRELLYQTHQKELTKQSQVGKITIDWSESRSIPFHAYLELYEMDPSVAYQNKLVDLTEEKKDSIHSIWFISCTILNQKQERVFQKTMILGIIPIQTLGMGYPITTCATTPVNLFQAIAKGISFLHPNMTNMDFIEAKVPAAFATDNYWMPIMHNQQRNLFDTTKQFISFASTKGLQLLRMPPAMLNKIDLKNKSANYPFNDIVAFIKKNRPRASMNEYYQVIQPLRDVNNNKDYTIKAYLEFNTDIAQSNETNKPALIFIPEMTHILYDGKDSVGNLVVKNGVAEKNKFYYPDQIYNGYDSSKKYTMGTSYGAQAIVHERVVEGKVLNHDFAIQFDFSQRQKTILMDNKIVMIIEGDKKPRQMVNLSTNTDLKLSNLLLMIAYSEIFQSPN